MVKGHYHNQLAHVMYYKPPRICSRMKEVVSQDVTMYDDYDYSRDLACRLHTSMYNICCLVSGVIQC